MFGVGWGANQFSPLLLAYQIHRGVSETTADALFGVYALGLIPALLIVGPISDRRGRRASVIGAGLVSLLASLALIAGNHALGLLYLGRFLAGVASGAAFAAGTAWVKELSGPPHDAGAGEQAGARRSAIALSAGFGLGPLVAGLIAQWAPDALTAAYLPHLVVMTVALVAVLSAPETVGEADGGRRPSVPASVRHMRFRLIVAPIAPWVFLAPSVSFAVLPGLVAHSTAGFRVGFAALIAGITLGVGILIQPVARRLDRTAGVRGIVTGLAAITAALLLGALAARGRQWPLVVPAGILFGAGYGLCLVSGLLEVQRLAPPAELASITAIFYALTYLGFAAPLVLAELERFAAAASLLLGAAALAILTALTVIAAEARYPAVAARSPT
jgi:MFS family permease